MCASDAAGARPAATSSKLQQPAPEQLLSGYQCPSPRSIASNASIPSHDTQSSVPSTHPNPPHPNLHRPILPFPFLPLQQRHLELPSFPPQSFVILRLRNGRARRFERRRSEVGGRVSTGSGRRAGSGRDVEGVEAEDGRGRRSDERCAEGEGGGGDEVGELVLTEEVVVAVESGF